MTPIDHRKDFAGKKPYKPGFNISVTTQAMALIGYITLQWGALFQHIEFQIKFKSKFPNLPNELREHKVRHEATQQIKLLRRIGRKIYAKERRTAVSEFNQILDKILKLKDTRDALVHGTFDLTSNKDPNVIVANYKKGKVSFTAENLRRTGDEIGIAHATLMMFDQWVYYERDQALLEKLLQQARQ
jgi:hypothetical protein